MNNLQWYRQNTSASLEFLVRWMEPGQNQTADPPHPLLSTEVHKNTKQLDLIISSAEVSDSALYYCALQPTVTGNPATLYKNLCRSGSSTHITYTLQTVWLHNKTLSNRIIRL